LSRLPGVRSGFDLQLPTYPIRKLLDGLSGFITTKQILCRCRHKDSTYDQMRLISLSLLSWPVSPGHDTNHPQRIQRDRSAGLRKQCPPRNFGT
jgi:hypothetical protein